MKNNKGFTLIEILAVIFVMVFLISAGIVSYRSFEKSTELENTSQNIISVLKLAQTKTTASEDASQYGIHFESDKYILFKGNIYQAESEDNKTYNISNRLEIYNINFSEESSDVIFQRISGATEQNGNISIKIISDPVKFKTISIESLGVIELSSITECCQTNRLTDTRHIHLNMGWSIQDSAILTVSSTNINMANYFNEDKTEFDWSGIIEIDGENQELQIRTYLLDETNTVLCIHRPKDRNNKQIDILIDSKNIISYSDIGEIAVGAYGGILEIQ